MLLRRRRKARRNRSVDVFDRERLVARCGSHNTRQCVGTGRNDNSLITSNAERLIADGINGLIRVGCSGDSGSGK